MFDRVSQAAERLAVHVSRRDFFGWAGKSALALAGVVGGTLAFPANANADQNSCWFCGCAFSGGTYYECAKQNPSVGFCACSFVHSGCGGCNNNSPQGRN